MAWHYVRGTTAHPADVQLLIPAIVALHASLSHVAKHPALDVNTTAWGRAHRDCWSRRPDDIEPAVAPLADALYARLQPLPSLPLQLIHGDLNPDNIVMSSQEAPGFIDFTPFWAPAGFALAIFANWLGPRRGDISVLSAFSAQPFFTQLLLRASIRMLLVVSNLGGTGSWAPERRAAELVIEYVSRES
jgi:hypothetical protein